MHRENWACWPRDLADRLRSGENLEEILQRDETVYPPVWRSVVLAGLRSGHLPAALEGLSQTVRRASDVRRSIAVALIYPFVVVAIACGFLLFSLTYLAPVLANAYRDSGVPSGSGSQRDRACSVHRRTSGHPGCPSCWPWCSSCGGTGPVGPSDH